MSNKVFFVDDDEVTLFLYKRLARKVGVEGIFCENGKVFLDKYREENSNGLVILDINMPVLNGLEVLKELDAAGEIAKVAVVAMLGSASKDEIRSQIEGFGVKQFADKHLNETKLYERLALDEA